jgi:hypothetical protein
MSPQRKRKNGRSSLPEYYKACCSSDHFSNRAAQRILFLAVDDLATVR